MPTFIRVCSVSDLPPGSCRTVQAGGQAIALFNCEGTFHAIDNTCAHRGGPLGEGTLDGTTVTCPWHGWQWDVTTGANAMGMPQKLRRFETKVEGDGVMVEV